MPKFATPLAEACLVRFALRVIMLSSFLKPVAPLITIVLPQEKRRATSVAGLAHLPHARVGMGGVPVAAADTAKVSKTLMASEFGRRHPLTQ